MRFLRAILVLIELVSKILFEAGEIEPQRLKAGYFVVIGGMTEVLHSIKPDRGLVGSPVAPSQKPFMKPILPTRSNARLENADNLQRVRTVWELVARGQQFVGFFGDRFVDDRRVN